MDKAVQAVQRAYKTYAVRLLRFVVGENAVNLLGYAVRLCRFITDNDAVWLLQFTLQGDAVSMH